MQIRTRGAVHTSPCNLALLGRDQVPDARQELPVVTVLAWTRFQLANQRRGEAPADLDGGKRPTARSIWTIVSRYQAR
jgi:hypothetical protein